MDCFFLASGTVAVDLRRDCLDWIPSRSSDQNTMKARQPEFRAIPQFDVGRWKLRLERVPAGPDNQITIGMDFNSVHKPGSTRPTRHIGSCYQSSAADANDKYPVEGIGSRQRLAKHTRQGEAGTRSVIELTNHALNGQARKNLNFLRCQFSRA